MKTKPTPIFVITGPPAILSISNHAASFFNQYQIFLENPTNAVAQTA